MAGPEKTGTGRLRRGELEYATNRAMALRGEHGGSLPALLALGYEVRLQRPRIPHSEARLPGQRHCYVAAVYTGGRYHRRLATGQGGTVDAAALDAHTKILLGICEACDKRPKSPGMPWCSICTRRDSRETPNG